MKSKSLIVGTSIISSILWMAAIVTLSPLSCTTAPERSVKFELSEQDQKKLTELQMETEIGRNMAGRLLAYYGNQSSEQLLKYVNRVGSFVASYSDYPDRRYMFEILNTDMINAFACPGGYVLISVGALRHAKTEAELAAILGHESAHVGYKHMFNALQEMSSDDLEKTANDSAKRKNLPESVLVRKRPEPESSETGTTLARYLQGASAGLNVLKAARAGMSLILDKGLGAEKEYQADREGVRYAVRAGYQPRAMEDFLCRLDSKGKPNKNRIKCKLKLKKSSSKKKAKTILDRTHPPISQRVRVVRKVLSEMSAQEIVGAVGKKRFEKYTAKLPVTKK